MWVLLKIHCRVGWRKNKEVGEGGGKGMCEERGEGKPDKIEEQSAKQDGKRERQTDERRLGRESCALCMSKINTNCPLVSSSQL